MKYRVLPFLLLSFYLSLSTLRATLTSRPESKGIVVRSPSIFLYCQLNLHRQSGFVKSAAAREGRNLGRDSSWRSHVADRDGA